MHGQSNQGNIIKNNKSFLMIHSFPYRNNTNISFFSQRYTVLHYILLVTGKLFCCISQKQNAHFSKTPVATLRYTSPLCSTNIRHTMTDLIARPRRLRKSPALRAMFEETTLTLNVTQRMDDDNAHTRQALGARGADIILTQHFQHR